MKTAKIDRIKEAVWNLSVTYDETAKKLESQMRQEYIKGSEEWLQKEKEAWLFKAYARGASNAYLAICAACKNK